MRVNFVGENLRRDTRQSKVKANAAHIFREHRSLKKLLTCQVVGTNVDERSFEAVTMKNSMKNGHGLGIVRGGVAKGAASAICQAVVEQNIAPTRRACTRMLANDSRAIGDKDCVKGIWRGSQKRVGELHIGGCKNVDARFKPVTERKPGFWLRQSTQ